MEKIFTYDNYVQDPTCQQGFNRYAYCFYNPLKYIDPTGERCYGPSEAEKMQRAANEARQRCWNELYRYMEEVDFMYQSIKHSPSLWGQDKGGIAHCNTTSSVGNFTHGTNGQSGTNNCGLLKYANLVLQSLPGDVKFSVFCMCLGIKPGQPIPENLRNDTFLKQFQQAFFPDAPMDYCKLKCDKYDMTEAGKTIPRRDKGSDTYNGLSNVYINCETAFSSPEKLYETMGHEIVHVSQYLELKGQDRIDLINVMDFFAYSWETSIGMGPSKSMQYNRPSNETFKKFETYKLNFIYFDWANPCKLIHP